LIISFLELNLQDLTCVNSHTIIIPQFYTEKLLLELKLGLIVLKYWKWYFYTWKYSSNL